MIEKTVLDYLLSCDIEGIGSHVYMETPVDPDESYILIEKTGSSRNNRINQAMIAIQSISEHSLLEAAEINSRVKESMDQLVYSHYGLYISKAVLNTDYNFTNTATKQYRYQAVYVLYFTKE